MSQSEIIELLDLCEAALRQASREVAWDDLSIACRDRADRCRQAVASLKGGKGLWRRAERKNAFLAVLDRPKTTMELALDLRWPVKKTYDIARLYAKRRNGKWMPNF